MAMCWTVANTLTLFHFRQIVIHFDGSFVCRLKNNRCDKKKTVIVVLEHCLNEVSERVRGREGEREIAREGG